MSDSIFECDEVGFLTFMTQPNFHYTSDFSAGYLNTEEREFLNEVAIEKSFRKDSEIFLEGAYPTGVYILKQGKVKLYHMTSGGSEQILDIHTVGEIFGYRPVLCNESYPVSAKTIEDSQTIFIPRQDFLTLLSRSTNLANSLLRLLSHEFTVWANTISNLAHRTVRDRLLINLLVLTEKYRVKDAWPVEITLSRRDLAALIGTSIETLARTLSKLKKEKLIAVQGRTIVITANRWDRIFKSIPPR